MDRSDSRSEEVQILPRFIRDSVSTRVTSHAETRPARAKDSKGLAFWAPILWMVGAFFIYVSFSMRTREQTCPSPRDQTSYSPAQDSIGYKEVVFTNAFTEISKYQGPPSRQLDRAWSDLYTHMTRVPKKQALKLENQTIEIPGDPGYYAVIFDVFHSLHCLDELRKQIWPEYYQPFAGRYHVTQEIADMHLDHCIDGLRQALMCGVDISTIPFRVGEDLTDIMTVAGHLHTCRDWEAFERYVVANEIQVPFHAKMKVENGDSTSIRGI